MRLEGVMGLLWAESTWEPGPGTPLGPGPGSASVTACTRQPGGPETKPRGAHVVHQSPVPNLLPGAGSVSVSDPGSRAGRGFQAPVSLWTRVVLCKATAHREVGVPSPDGLAPSRKPLCPPCPPSATSQYPGPQDSGLSPTAAGHGAGLTIIWAGGGCH